MALDGEVFGAQGSRAVRLKRADLRAGYSSSMMSARRLAVLPLLAVPGLCWAGASYAPKTPAGFRVLEALPPLISALPPQGRVVAGAFLQDHRADPVAFRRELETVPQDPQAMGETVHAGLEPAAGARVQASIEGVAYRADGETGDLRLAAQKIVALREALKLRLAPYYPQSESGLNASLELIGARLGRDEGRRLAVETAGIAARMAEDAAKTAGPPPPAKETGSLAPAPAPETLPLSLAEGDEVECTMLGHCAKTADAKGKEVVHFFRPGTTATLQKLGTHDAQLVNDAGESLRLSKKWIVPAAKPGDLVRLEPGARVVDAVRDFFATGARILFVEMERGPGYRAILAGEKEGEPNRVAPRRALRLAPRVGDRVHVLGEDGKLLDYPDDLRLAEVVMTPRPGSAGAFARAVMWSEESGLVSAPLDNVRPMLED